MEDSFIVSVTSGKGGVGKTLVSVHLSIALAKLGEKVLLIDGDFGLSNADIVLGTNPDRDLSSYFRDRAHLKDLVINTNGISFIPAYSGMREAFELFPERAKELLKDIKELSKTFDFTLIDTGSGISNKVTSLCNISDLLVVVTTKEPSSTVDAYATLKVLRENYGIKNIYLLVNRVSGTEGLKVHRAINEASKRFLGMEIPLAGYLPEDEKAVLSVKERDPSILEGGILSKALFEIASKLKKLKEGC